MLKIQKEYENINTEKYNPEDPENITYTPFTHIYYVSGTPCSTLPDKSTDIGKTKYIVKDSSELL